MPTARPLLEPGDDSEGGGLVRCPRHLRCCGCNRWIVKGTGAERAPYGYLCSGCMAPEPPEEVRLVAAFDAVAAGDP